MNSKPPKPRIGVFKFASCDGCQLSILDAEDDLLGWRSRPRLLPRSLPPHGQRPL